MKFTLKSAIPVVLLIVAIASIGLAYVKMNSKLDAPVAGGNKAFHFRTFTSAVCEPKGEFTYCHDEFFVNCNGNVSNARDIAECNGVKIEAPKALGFAVLGKEWEDPRD